MKLNWHCFFGVLETVQNYSTVTASLSYNIFDDLIGKYGKDQVDYCIHQASENGLLLGGAFDAQGTFIGVSDLSLAGHEYLLNKERLLSSESPQDE